MKVDKSKGKGLGLNLGQLVSSGGKKTEETPSTSPVQKPREVEDVSGTFEELVVQFGKEFETQEVERILSEIERLGEVLSHHPSLESLALYKAAIANLMKKLVPDLYEVIEKKSVHYMKNKKVYTIAQRINEELERLTQDIVSRQKENLKLLSKIDDIRGLIIDFVSASLEPES